MERHVGTPYLWTLCPALPRPAVRPRCYATLDLLSIDAPRSGPLASIQIPQIHDFRRICVASGRNPLHLVAKLLPSPTRPVLGG